VRSEAVLTLVATRAHVLAVMRDPRLGLHAKTVACLLWASSETWERGESRTVSLEDIGAQIVTAKNGQAQPLSRASVRRALGELEDAGYVLVDRTGCVGRGKRPTIQMIRRHTDDPLTQDEGGPWRVWTKQQRDRVKQCAELFAETNQDSAKGSSPGTLLSEKGAWPDTHYGERVPGQAPIERKGSPARHPLKETFPEGDPEGADLHSTPPPPRGDAADASALEGLDWDSLTTAGDVVELLSQALTTHGQAEVRKRAKRREIERGVGTLMAKGWDMPRVLAGVGLWAGDRELRNADVLDEIASRLIRTQLASPARLVLHQPLDLLRQSFALGEEVRRERENAAQRTVVGQ